MSEFRADLHVHTSCSDGTDTPLQVLHLAKAAGLSGLSITDHDTAQAYDEELMREANRLQIELLIGSEISSEMDGLTVHILAYGFQRSLEPFLQTVQEKRILRNRTILEKLRKKGIILEEEELRTAGPLQILGRPHFAEALLKKGAVASFQEAFDRYLNDTACCYVPGGKYTPREVIDAVHECRGKAVIAHPHFLKKGSFLKNLLSLPFDGLECYYSRFTKEQEKPWLREAGLRKWIATGGSDYHGTRRPHIPIGCSWVDEATFRKLQS